MPGKDSRYVSLQKEGFDSNSWPFLPRKQIPRSNDNKNWWEYVDRRVTQSKLEGQSICDMPFVILLYE